MDIRLMPQSVLITSYIDDYDIQVWPRYLKTGYFIFSRLISIGIRQISIISSGIGWIPIRAIDEWNSLPDQIKVKRFENHWIFKQILKDHPLIHPEVLIRYWVTGSLRTTVWMDRCVKFMKYPHIPKEVHWNRPSSIK